MDTLAQTARRLTATLFATQSMASAGLIASITVMPIIGTRLSGNESLAGLPITLMLAGAATIAYPAGRFMQQFGRRPGLALGFLLGLAGMLIDAGAVVLQSFWLFLLGLLVIGMARGITDQSRYAAADTVPVSQRARAISIVVFASTVGAVGGPLLVGPLGRAALQLGLPELAGPMLGGAVLFLVGGVLIQTLLRPDPRSIALRLAADQPDGSPTQPAGPARSVGEVLRQPLAQIALTAMVFGQVVMVLVMSVTSLHMDHHGHGLGDISLVIGAHTLGMFGFSMLTGVLADRIGRPMTTAIGALILIAGALIAPLSVDTPWLALALFLVGLGWNFCYIAGSSLLADTLQPSERGRVQGASDLLVNLASASGGLSSGFILAGLGYGWLCIIGALLSLAPLLMAGLRARAALPAVSAR